MPLFQLYLRRGAISTNQVHMLSPVPEHHAALTQLYKHADMHLIRDVAAPTLK